MRFEVSIGKPHGESFGPCQIPGAESAAGRVAGQSGRTPVLTERLGDGVEFSIAAT